MRVLPITAEEFSRELQKCIIWPTFKSRIAVANSGGPDSTCLLFLLHRHIYLSCLRKPKLLSFYVDHNLQSASVKMAKVCQSNADILGVEHLSPRITWGEGQFPPCPNGSMENTARMIRYSLLFDCMQKSFVDVIAFGHHADDQVETALIRLAKGSKERGLAGMMHYRRWGMGFTSEEDRMGWFGYSGMDRWIMRPLLAFSKDRLLATCQENNLEYYIDQTNFQPSLTLRNAIRHRLNTSQTPVTLPTDLMNSLTNIDNALPRMFGESVSLSSGSNVLRSAVGGLSAKYEGIEAKVSGVIKLHTLPSPSGTHLISARIFQNILDPKIKYALIYRILRYISPHPWGSLSSVAHCSSRKLDQIASKLSKETFTHTFSAGASVLWTMVRLTSDGFRFVNPQEALQDVNTGWLSSRMPPLKAMERQKDITTDIRQALEDGRNSVRVLYDCRFLLTFDLTMIPKSYADEIRSSSGRIYVDPYTRWYWPSVKWCSGPQGQVRVVHNTINGEMQSSRIWGEGISEAWISIRWYRPLSEFPYELESIEESEH